MLQFYDSWLYRLILNFYGYAFIIVPLFLFIRFYKSRYPHGFPGNTCYSSFVRDFVYGHEEELPVSIASEHDADQQTAVSKVKEFKERTYMDNALQLVAPRYREAAKLSFCFCGLQLCYVTWGYFQERVMTVSYNFETPKLAHGFQPQREEPLAWKLSNGSKPMGPGDPAASEAGKGEFFRDSQFLVFANRVFAMFLAGGILLVRARAASRPGRTTSPRAAAYKYSFASLSNTLSSWFQYEALKYVSFPTQVICKSAKMVATMFMSKLVSSVTRSRSVTYSGREWATACAISVGVCLFLLGSEYEEYKTRAKAGRSSGNKSESDWLSQTQTSVSGILILGGYLVADSFTTTYQASLFRKYHMSSVAMMFAINTFSFACCGVSLLCQGAFTTALHFIAAHPDFLVHIAVVSFTSALGQLFIFYTIDQFGAVTFALIMTARQAFSIVISCFAFAHPVTLLGWTGLAVAVVATVLRSQSGSASRPRNPISPTQSQSQGKTLTNV